jgi:hypothetical protein
MRLILSAVLSLGFAAAALAQSPCDTLAEAINKSQEAGAKLDDVAKALLESRSAFPGMILPRGQAAELTVDGVAFTAENRAIARNVPHVTGLRFVEMREGDAACQKFAFYRLADGIPRATRRIDGDAPARCGIDAARLMGIGGRAYLADIAADPVSIVLRRVSRGGPHQETQCGVTIEARVEGRIVSTDTADAAAQQALRVPQTELERVMPDLAGAFLQDTDWVPPDFRLRERSARRRVLEFAAGPGRYIATLSRVTASRPSDGVSVRIARLFPELGNREREIGGFVYAGELRFVRALASDGELR